MEPPRSHLLFLPLEIILEILQYLDYRALIYARQTCKALYGITNSEQFWTTLAHDLCYKPGIGKLAYPLGNYSTVELMNWTLRRLRARDRWASDDPSQPLQFRSRLIDGGRNLYRTELLRGGRWLFTMGLDGTVHILDLEKEAPQPQFLFDTSSLPSGDPHHPLIASAIWVDETKPELSFRVATCSRAHGSRIGIHQIHCIGLDSSFVVMPPIVIQDYPPRDIIFGTVLSERFFLQCFALLEGNDQRVSTVLRLHWYSQGLPHSASQFIEKTVECTGKPRVFFIPSDRVVYMTPTFIDIYTVNLDQDSTPLKLVLLHHLPFSWQMTHLLSPPFIGSRCTYLVGIYKGTFSKITIEHSHNSSPIVEELGRLGPLPLDMMFGPSASVVPQSKTSLRIITYECRVDQASFRRKQYKGPDDQPLFARHIVGFDDSVGRIVLWSNLDQLTILDLI